MPSLTCGLFGCALSPVGFSSRSVGWRMSIGGKRGGCDVFYFLGSSRIFVRSWRGGSCFLADDRLFCGSSRLVGGVTCPNGGSVIS